MRIDNEIKLDYSDVLLRPKRSTLTSRKEVKIERSFTFYHSPKKWTGVPIMTANMATSGTFELARFLAPYKILTTFHKYYTVKDYKEFFKDFNNPDYIAFSIGIREKDFALLKEMKKENLLDNFSFICLDVPNGYLEVFAEKVKELRELCPKHIIIAGNVVTNEMTEELILSGADIVKVGIGPGCFSQGTEVLTQTGYKNIEDIGIGEEVLTHKQRYKTVIGIEEYEEKNELIQINNNLSTLEHKYLVSYKNNLNKEIWLEAQHIDEKNNVLIKLKNNHKEFIDIITKKVIDYSGPVYDLEVEDDHSFTADDIIVHNSACTTRKMTGVGYPQLSAVIECADAAHGISNEQGCGLIIADGGLQYPSCIAKAYCAGADFIMAGSMFSGYEESGGKVIEKDGKKFKEYFGSSSNKAMEEFYGKKDTHRASEGRYIHMPYKGEMSPFLQDLFGSLRSTGTYIGAKSIKEFSKRATFIRVNKQLTDYLVQHEKED